MTEAIFALPLAQKLASGGVQPPLSPVIPPVENSPDVSSFSDVLANLGQSASTKLNTAEEVSMNALQGQADPRAVADAVLQAEQSLQVAIAVRDKIVTAYLEISRMAI